MYSQASFLSESEVVELCIEALQGKKQAQKRLIQEYRIYEQLVKEKVSFTSHQKELYDEMVESLQLFAPEVLPPAETKKPEKIIVKKPKKKDDGEQKQPKIAVWKAEANKFFPFKEGTLAIYTGRSKKIFQEEWGNNGKTLTSMVLKVKEKKDGSIEALLFNEVLTQQEQYTAEQTLEKWELSSKGIRIQREVVLNQPFPGNYLPVGKQEPYPIAQLPFQQGDSINGYKILTVSTEIATPLQKFQEVVVVKGTVENFSFAPHFGLVSREIYDEQWIIKERKPPEFGENKLTVQEQASVLRQIKKFCKKSGFNFESALSFSVKESEPVLQVRACLLVSRKERQDPDQKRVQILKQEWVKTGKGKKADWRIVSQF